MEYTFRFSVRFARRKNFTPLAHTVIADDVKTASKLFTEYVARQWDSTCKEIRMYSITVKVPNQYVTWNCKFKDE